MPEGSAAMKQQALSFTPPAGESCVYVIRPPLPGPLGVPLYYINLDGQEFGSLVPSSFLFGILQPGEHTLFLNAGMGGTSRIHFTAEAAKNNYFWIEESGATLGLKPITETDGQIYVLKCKPSADNLFDRHN